MQETLFPGLLFWRYGSTPTPADLALELWTGGTMTSRDQQSDTKVNSLVRCIAPRAAVRSERSKLEQK